MGLDAGGVEARACTPAITYADRRAVPVLNSIRERDPAFAERCGRPLSAELLIAVHEWFLQTQDHKAVPATWVSLKDYVVWCLTGEWGIDSIHASYSGFIARGDWDTAGAAGLPRCALLAPIQYPYQRAGVLTPDAARALGVSASVPVTRGTSDGSSSMLGGGALEDGTAAMTAGSTDVVMMGISVERCAAVRGANPLVWNAIGPADRLVGASTGATGRFLQVLNERWAAPGLMRANIADCAPGAAGLTVFPALDGERAPSLFSAQRGAIIGMGLEHDAAHVKRAVVEAAALRAAAILDSIAEHTGAPIDRILAGGGALQDAEARLVRAAVCNKPVYALCTGETAVLGSALLGFAALHGGTDGPSIVRGIWNNWRAELVDPQPTVASPELVALYRRIAARYNRIETALRPVWTIDNGVNQ